MYLAQGWLTIPEFPPAENVALNINKGRLFYKGFKEGQVSGIMD